MRVTAEIWIGDKQLPGLVVDLSPNGLFVQLDGAKLPACGTVVDLELAESSFGPAMTLRGEVVRRSRASGQPAARGVGIRIVEAPPEYHDCFASLFLENALDSEAAAAGPPAAARRSGEALRDLLSPAPLGPAEPAPGAARAGVGLGRSLLSAPGSSDVPRVPGSGAGGTVASASREGEPRGEASELDELEQDPGVLAGPSPPERPLAAAEARRSEIWCVYDGAELDDVYRQLEAVGARPKRARFKGAPRFRGWDAPPRMFITPASAALRVELPATARGWTVGIAVADVESETLGRKVARRGYDYLIQRPVHPEMLRLLFQRLLYAGHEGRRHERHAAGWPVRLRSGWCSERATLLDLSAGGARLLVRRDIGVRAEVRLRIPRAWWQRAISLRGRVIRKRRHADGTGSLAIRFLEKVDRPTLEALRCRLEGLAVGPAPPPRASRLARVLGWWSRPRGSTPLSVEAPPPPVEEAAPERRRMPRVELDREVLDLDLETGLPRHVLEGRDLSARGLRVDAHPDLRLGDELSLALFDAAGSPLQLRARVARDDGERGLALQFEQVDDQSAPRLDALIGTLPPIARLDGGKSRRVVFARIASAE
jgi:hypothetical protein